MRLLLDFGDHACRWICLLTVVLGFLEEDECETFSMEPGVPVAGAHSVSND